MVLKYLLKTLKHLFFLILLFNLALVILAFGSGIYLINNNPHSFSLKTYRNQDAVRSSMRPLSEVPVALRDLVLFVEDTRFYEHSGIDLRSIDRALDINKNLGFKAYGGSTITQQVTRTLFLTPAKNYFRKYTEVIIALVLDLILSKDRLLELYFSYVEWGDGIFGVFDAAQYNFEKDVSRLTVEEQVRLVTILPNPRVFTVRNFHETELMQARYKSLGAYIARKGPVPIFNSSFSGKPVEKSE